MTTHETQPETMNTGDDMNRGAVPSSEPTFSEASAPSDDLSQRRGTQDHVGQDSGTQSHVGKEPLDQTNRSDTAATMQDPSGPAHAATTGSTDQTMFGEGDLSGFRSRWTEVQAAFVDDPRDCVQKADGLVSDVVDRLTSGFAQARSGLEEQWSRGEQVSTEDLRLALQRYRDFFERLLAV